MHSWIVFRDILKNLRVLVQMNQSMFLWIWCSQTRKVIQQMTFLWGNMTMMILFLKSCKIWWKLIFLTTPQQPVATIHVLTLPPTTKGERFLHKQSQVPIYNDSPTCMLKALVLILQFKWTSIYLMLPSHQWCQWFSIFSYLSILTWHCPKVTMN